MRRGSSGLNLLLGIDKPSGMSSHDVVNRVRGILRERRVGHAGTLDPAATGVLVLGVGQGTRLMGMLTSNTKSYVATIAFGAQTNTDDAEGEVVGTAGVPPELEDESFARNVLQGIVGPQLQVPPAFSAISKDGRRAYQRARAGENVVLEPREVTVETAILLSVSRRESDAVLCWDCAFTVSKGTYIRALARDLGLLVGSRAHLSALRRTASGQVTIGDCVTLEDLEAAGASRVTELSIDPVTALGHATYALDDKTADDVKCGRRLSLRGRDYVPGQLVSMVCDDRLMGVWEATDRSLNPKVTFPQGIAGVWL